MSGYATGESLVLSLVQKCTGFDATNTAQGNWKLLNKGKSDHYAILRPGPFMVEWITFSKYAATYTTVIELWQRYKDDGTSQTNLYTQAGNLMTGIMPECRLNDTGKTILSATVTSAGEVQEMWLRGGGPQWLKWELQLVWTESVDVSFTD